MSSANEINGALTIDAGCPAPRVGKPMSKLAINQEGAVSTVDITCKERLRMLMSMGILPGVRVKVLQKFPSVLFEAGYSQFAIDHEMAEKIMICA